MDWYIDLHLQWDPHPFLFGSPARYVASCSLLLRNRLTSDPLPVAKSARPRPPLRPQLPLQQERILQENRLPTPHAFTIGRFGFPPKSPSFARTRSESPFSSADLDYHSATMSDNEMSGPAPTEPERVSNLEQAVAEMKSEIAASHKLFQTYISQRMGKTPPTEDSPPPRRPSSRLSDTTSAGRKKLSLKPSTPSEFDGDRTKGKAFLTSCR